MFPISALGNFDPSYRRLPKIKPAEVILDLP
jgi:hypothetical protein